MPNRIEEFMHDIDRLGAEIDDLAPVAPQAEGYAAWVAARVSQAVGHVHSTSSHRVDSITLNVPKQVDPDALTAAWPEELPPVTITTTISKYDDPIPSGVFRMWLEVSYAPDTQDPAAESSGAWLADMAHAHGILPDEVQEQRLRRMSSTGAVWAVVNPDTLDEALDAVEKARRA